MNRPDLPSHVVSPPGVDRRSLPVSVADQLREMIIEGRLPAGTHLNERMLCDSLGVSRTPLREALRQLSSQGLVQIQPNRGARVVALSVEDVRESFQVMGALEALSGELACLQVTDAEIAEIRALTYEMQACHARRDLSAYYRLNCAIHEHINRASRNRLLAEVYATLNLRIQNLRFRSNLNPDKWDAAMREHIQMVDALAARDGVRLAAILRAHMRRKGETVLEDMAVRDVSDAALPEA